MTTHSRRRRAIVGLAIGALAMVPLVGVSASTAVGDPAADQPVVNPVAIWSHSLNDKSKQFYFGSPGVGTLDGQGPSVIVGNQQGKVYAWHVSDGSSVSGWPYVSTTSVQSTPSVLGSGSSAMVFVGFGVSTAKTHGGYTALRANGKKAWSKHAFLLPGDRGGTRGVMSSLAVGPIQTSADVVGGAMGQLQWAMKASTGSTLKGFAWLQADTNFSTPALADIFGTGHDEIIEGGDSTKGIAGTYHYTNGGHIRILSYKGNSGKKYKNEGLVCQRNTNQVVQSSPAVGGFLANGATGIVVGTGSYFHHASDNHKIIAINTKCKDQWTKILGGSSHPSPAIADADGDGKLDVLVNSEAGDVWSLNGADGAKQWKTQLPDSTVGSLTTFQAPGANFQYVLVTSVHGLYILDGRDGHVVQHIATQVRMLNSAAVTADPDGSIGITIAGAVSGHSEIDHYRVNGTSGVTTVQSYGSWPMFHHDPQLTGYAPYVAQAIP